MSVVKLINYIRLCFKVGWLEHNGILTKEEADNIVWDYLTDG